jgi:hypothetical protein
MMNIDLMTVRPAAKDGDEVDAFSRKARRALKWRRGEVRGIKTRARRRNRRQAREALRVERY